MASLTQTAYYTRRTINWMILGLIAYFILRILWSVTVVAFKTFFPAKPPPPNHAFNKLPALVFPQNNPPANIGQLSFRLETIQGVVPEASATAAIYFMPKQPANLLALTKTQDFAKTLQFDPSPQQESKNIYRFTDSTNSLRRLRYDIVTDNFILRYAFEEDLTLFAEKNFATVDALMSQTRNIMQSYGLYKEDLAGGPTRVMYLQLDGKNLIQTSSLSKSDAVRIDFFRRQIGGLPILYPNPDDAPISIIYSGSRDARKRMLQFAYTYWPIDYQTVASYALKTSTQAWQDLQGGAGYIARYPQQGNTAVIRNVYVAYYDSFDPQTYLQPVFVFEGDDGFVAYVPAIASEWTE